MHTHTFLNTLPRANGIPLEGTFPKQMYSTESFFCTKPASPSMVPRSVFGNTYIPFHAQNMS